MGTSSSNRGPKGRTPLLPSWAGGTGSSSDGKGRDGSSGQTRDWSLAKGSFSRFVSREVGSGGGSSGGGERSGSFKSASRGYVKTLGGPSKATTAARRGIAIGGGLVDFFVDVEGVGALQALENFGLDDCVGKPVDEVLSKVFNRIAPSGATNEEAIARKALYDTTWLLLERMENDENGIQALDSLSEVNLKETVKEFVVNYVFQKWIYEVGLSIEKSEMKEHEVISLERDIKVFIREEVTVAMKSQNILKFDIKKGEGKRIVEKVFELAYSTIEK